MVNDKIAQLGFFYTESVAGGTNWMEFDSAESCLKLM